MSAFLSHSMPLSLQSPLGFPGLKMPQFDAGPHRVWGLTAYVLTGILNEIVFPECVLRAKL